MTEPLSTRAVIESSETDPPNFTGAIGHFIHAINGTYLIPLLGIILLIVSFFAKVDGDVKWAVIVAASIAVQVTVGISSPDVPTLGLIHGLNAFVLFGAALMAAKSAKGTAVDSLARLLSSLSMSTNSGAGGAGSSPAEGAPEKRP